MPYQPYSVHTIAREFRDKDFIDVPNLLDENYRKEILKKSVNLATEPHFHKALFKKIHVKKKDGYSAKNIQTKLLLRTCSRDLRFTTKRRTPERNLITRELKQVIRNGTKFRIYKLDIKSFFESMQHHSLKLLIDEDTRLSTHLKKLLFSYLDTYNQLTGSDLGVPRGVDLSSAVGEYYLEHFDKMMQRNTKVIYYARFVDDIIIVTNNDEKQHEFMKFVFNNLPSGLRVNKNKEQILTFGPKLKAHNKSEEIQTFSFLGYKYIIRDESQLSETKNTPKEVYEPRKVIVDISDGKTKKIKTKISKAIISCSANLDISLLRDRVIFLATNRSITRDKKQGAIETGIFYNYSECTEELNNFKSIDSFLNAILHDKSRLGKKLNHSINHSLLSNEEKKEMLQEIQKVRSISFYRGHTERKKRRFGAVRMKKILEIEQ